MTNETCSNPLPGDNRHPVDALHDVREKLKALQVEEALLRDALIKAAAATADAPIRGSLYQAVVKPRSKESISCKTAREALLPEVYEKLAKKSEYSVIEIEPCAEG